MGKVRFLSSTEIIGNKSVPILVMDMEHHGKVGLHSHDFYEIVYIDKGFSMHTCNGQVNVLTSGDLFAIKPGQIHSYTSAHHTFLYNCLFCIEAISGMEEEINKLPGIGKILTTSEEKWQKLHLDFPERREVVLLLERMKWEQLNRAVGWEISLKSNLWNFLVFYSRIYASNDNEKSESKRTQILHIHKALKYIEENYHRDFLLRDMASSLNITADYISRQLKNEIGLSTMEYLRNYRVAKAMEMLKLSQKSISEIGRSCGFSDISNFSRQFKSVVGISPSKFRKEQEI